MLYRAWAEGLPGRSVNLWSELHKARMDIDQDEFLPLVPSDSGVGPKAAVSHALIGLERRGLITGIAWGHRDHVVYKKVAFEFPVIAVPTHSGLELYGWAVGQAGVDAGSFMSLPNEWTDPSLPRLARYRFPLIDDADEQ